MDICKRRTSRLLHRLGLLGVDTLRFIAFIQGEDHGKGRALTHSALHIDLGAVRLEEVIRTVQPQAGSRGTIALLGIQLWFGAEKRAE